MITSSMEKDSYHGKPTRPRIIGTTMLPDTFVTQMDTQQNKKSFTRPVRPTSDFPYPFGSCVTYESKQAVDKYPSVEAGLPTGETDR